jgi:WhiB family redox-sensing transcriptional regulator
MKKAACKGIDPDLFMPLRGENLKIKKAKEICASCPVQLECRNYGLQLAQIYDTHGIFGGWTRQQRSKELRRLGLSQRRWGSGGPQNMKHGTKLGYLTHILAGETPCEICVEAEAGQAGSLVR